LRKWAQADSAPAAWARGAAGWWCCTFLRQAGL